jgi:cell division protease FtsH
LAGSGPDLPHARSHSEETAREIDEEVKRIVDRSIEQVRRILETRRVALEAITQRLIECEVIDGDELKAIVERSVGAPQIVPGTAAERRAARQQAELADTPASQADAGL